MDVGNPVPAGLRRWSPLLAGGSPGSDARVVDSLHCNALLGNPTCIVFWLKNRDPSNWRDVQNLSADVGHYILSDRPMTEDEWIAQLTKVIDARPSTGLDPVVRADARAEA